MSEASDPTNDFIKCQSNKCEAWAVAEFRWPGRDWQPACMFCARRAAAIADAMGFVLESREHPQHQRIVDLLLGDSRTRRLEVD